MHAGKILHSTPTNPIMVIMIHKAPHTYWHCLLRGAELQLGNCLWCCQLDAYGGACRHACCRVRFFPAACMRACAPPPPPCPIPGHGLHPNKNTNFPGLWLLRTQRWVHWCHPLTLTCIYTSCPHIVRACSLARSPAPSAHAMPCDDPMDPIWRSAGARGLGRPHVYGRMDGTHARTPHTCTHRSRRQAAATPPCMRLTCQAP